MQPRMAWLFGALVLGSAGWAALSIHRDSAPARETGHSSGTSTLAKSESANSSPRTGDLQQQLRQSLHEATAWLARRSLPHAGGPGELAGQSEAVREDWLRQEASVALALAHSARFTDQGDRAALAGQRIRFLLEHYPGPAPHDHLPAAAPLLVLAVRELPKCAHRLRAQAEQICRSLAAQQRPDGALADLDDNDEAVGEILQALVHGSQRPAEWKLGALRRACAYYLPHWRTHRNLSGMPAQVKAYAEAYHWTGEACFADAVTEMADWLCRQQYTRLDAQHPDWLGGFRDWVDGQPLAMAPTIRSASCAEALTAAWAVTRQTGDAVRCRRYRLAVERCLRFVLTLQYRPDASSRVAEWYRPVLQGGFCVSHEDGSLRPENARHAVGALVGYLAAVGHLDAGQQKADGRVQGPGVYYLLSAAFFDSGRRPAGALAVVDVS